MTRRVKDKYLCGEKNLKEIHLKLFDEEEKIGYHMVANSDIVDLDNSPELVKCSGCEKNFNRRRKKGMRREEIFLLVENIKIRNRMEENGKRSYEYILDILIRKNYNSDKEELKFSVRYDDNLENEFKAIIRGIILGILIIDRGSDVGLGVNSYVLRLLEKFKNSSNRRKLDEELYLELAFLENYMEKMNRK
ncbi:hypothetical protein RhiirB3_395630 [Rhizophagus irregularis]|nr:hypothetical protein RhiirB3_395630 [Rhizophagus irregularis]